MAGDLAGYLPVRRSTTRSSPTDFADSRTYRGISPKRSSSRTGPNSEVQTIALVKPYDRSIEKVIRQAIASSTSCKTKSVDVDELPDRSAR